MEIMVWKHLLSNYKQSDLEVEAGGTVYVMEGTYRNQNYGTVNPSANTNMSNPHVVTNNKSGLENNYITLKNYPGHSPVIEFDGKGRFKSQMI